MTTAFTSLRPGNYIQLDSAFGFIEPHITYQIDHMDGNNIVIHTLHHAQDHSKSLRIDEDIWILLGGIQVKDPRASNDARILTQRDADIQIAIAVQRALANASALAPHYHDAEALSTGIDDMRDDTAKIHATNLGIDPLVLRSWSAQ